jgi:hypothetical protein
MSEQHNDYEEDPISLDDDDEALSLEAAEEEEEPLTLVDMDGETHTGVRAFGAAATGSAAKHQEFRRTPNADGTGAIRCKLFHSKVADSSLIHMQDAINEWADKEGIEIKHVGHMVGTMTGKKAEENVIIMVWY